MGMDEMRWLEATGTELRVKISSCEEYTAIETEVGPSWCCGLRWTLYWRKGKLGEFDSEAELDRFAVDHYNGLKG